MPRQAAQGESPADQANAGQGSSGAETHRGDQEMKMMVVLILLFITNAVLAIIEGRRRRAFEQRLMEPDEEDR
jgi:hypothetical protein